MGERARIIAERETTYRGTITTPERWDRFRPRPGDVIVVTPSKSGTTWTQAIVAMLLRGSTDLPARVTEMSPWWDANFTDIDAVVAALEAQPGRRAVKTHTPADGFPVWAGVKRIAVFRHPLEVMLSLRKHLRNFKGVDDATHPLLAPLDEALDFYLHSPGDPEDFDRDTIGAIIRHYRVSVRSGRMADGLVLHYAEMLRDHGRAVEEIDTYLETGASDALKAAIVGATAFGAMKARATDFAPEAGTGAWHDEAAFFAGGTSGGWRDAFPAAAVAAYDARMAELVPDAGERRWIETGRRAAG